MDEKPETMMALLARDIDELRRTLARVESESKERDARTDRILNTLGMTVIVGVLTAAMKLIGFAK